MLVSAGASLYADRMPRGLMATATFLRLAPKARPTNWRNVTGSFACFGGWFWFPGVLDCDENRLCLCGSETTARSVKVADANWTRTESNPGVAWRVHLPWRGLSEAIAATDIVPAEAQLFRNRAAMAESLEIAVVASTMQATFGHRREE